MEDFNHLIDFLKNYYDVKVVMEVKDFVKIELDQVYDNWRFIYQWSLPWTKLSISSTMLTPSKGQDSPHSMSTQTLEPKSNLPKNATYLRKWEGVHSANSWQTTLLCRSSGPNISNPPECNCCPTIQSDGANTQECQTTPWLCCHTRSSSAHLL